MPALKWEHHMKKYVRELYTRSYPPSADRLRDFNKTFLDDINLQHKKRHQLKVYINGFCMAIRNNILPFYLKGNHELEEMFDQLVADYKKTSKASPAKSKDSATSSTSLIPSTGSAHEKDEVALIKNETLVDRLVEKELQLEEMQDIYAQKEVRHLKKINEMTMEIAEYKKQLVEKEQQLLRTEKQLEDLKDSYAKKETRHLKKIGEMVEEMAKKDEMTQDLTKKNEDFAKNLAEKDEQCQQMEKEMEKMKEAIKYVPNQIQQYEEIRQFLEKKVWTLESTVDKKDEMLKSCLRMQETLLQSAVNKPTPGDSQL